MLSRLDDIIYPNRCEVIEIEASHRYIYPIFKNGSSSLYEHACQNKCKILLNNQIKRIPKIDIILRDPVQRFLSGFNTYVYNTKRDNPHLDVDTIIYFAEEYLFLNRHYAPQLSWIVNLSKYINNDTILNLHSIGSMSNFTNISIKPIEVNMLSDKVIDRLTNNVHNEMYQRLDRCLLELVGQEITFDKILSYLRKQDSTAYLKLQCIVLD
jgi:hypothetical protein